MNKIVMVVWGLVVASMLFLVLMIGYKKQDKTYINLTKELKSASERYIKDNGLGAKVGDSVIVFVKDLIDGNYIKENEVIDDYCIDGIIYSHDIIKDQYTIRTNCEDKKNEE